MKVLAVSKKFQIGDKINVAIGESFDIQIDNAPQGTHAFQIEGRRLDSFGSTGDRTETGFTDFHFSAVSAGIQKINFPPTVHVVTVEIQKT